MTEPEIRKILVIGGGTMGKQIALQGALHGCNVVLYDLQTELLEKALAGIRKMAGRVAAHQGVPPGQAETILERIAATTDPKIAAADVDLVSESVPEDPALKERVFSLFGRLCPPHTVFTTNTSTLLPSMIAPATGRPEKFLAFHFHDIRATTVVDIMPHPGTDPEATELVRAFAERIGLIPIVLKREAHGYVFNFMLMALSQAAQTLATEGIASVEDIDRAWMGVTGMFLGPFGIMDSVGIDTVCEITRYWAGKNNDPQGLKNAEFLKRYIDEGRLGQKSGQGFYTYPKPLFTRPGFIRGHFDIGTSVREEM
jgi:3-hydroxybutyryl-CoA dehydrogenase